MKKHAYSGCSLLLLLTLAGGLFGWSQSQSVTLMASSDIVAPHVTYEFVE